jgi:hypothetical protein
MQMISQMQTLITTTDVPSRAVKDISMDVLLLGKEND